MAVSLFAVTKSLGNAATSVGVGVALGPVGVPEGAVNVPPLASVAKYAC